MQIKIKRETSYPCCNGTMTADDKLIGFTLERPWLENKSLISAIPAGIYNVMFTMSKRFNRQMLLVLDVPNREGIRIHGANKWRELEGCIAVSRERVDAETIRGSQVSVLEKLVREALYRGEDIKLEIINLWETPVVT